MAHDNRPSPESPLDVIERALRMVPHLIGAESALPARVTPSDDGLEALAGLGLDGRPHPVEQVIHALQHVLQATPASASPRFLNQLFGGRDAVATAAEMLAALPNTSMYTFKVGGPQILIERQVIQRILAKVGFEGGEGAFCPGGSLSNLTAMAIARNETLDGVRGNGLGGARPVIYSSEEGHYSIRKNAGLLGIGRDMVRPIGADSRGRMKPSELAARLAADRRAGLTPVLVNATAGTTVRGAFDPVAEIAEIAGEHGVWLHVDGAFGGSALFSTQHRHLLDGVERADSFTWDAHKMMGVPLSCSLVLLRRRGLLQAHLSEHAAYLFQADEDELNPGTRSLQCGRRNDALKLWASWTCHGDEGYAARIDHLFALARHTAERITADPDLELAAEPESVNVCFRVRARSSEAICDRLDRDGVLKIGHGDVDGRSAIRMVCVNPALGFDDIDRILEEIKAAARSLGD